MNDLPAALLILFFGLLCFVSGFLWSLDRHFKVVRRARRIFASRAAADPFDIYKAIHNKRENHWMSIVFIARWFAFRIRRTWFQLLSPTSEVILLPTFFTLEYSDDTVIRDELRRYGFPVKSVQSYPRRIFGIGSFEWFFGSLVQVTLERRPMVTETVDTHNHQHVTRAAE